MSGPSPEALAAPSEEVFIERVPVPKPPKPPDAPGFDQLDHRPAKHVMMPVHFTLNALLRGVRTHFEKGTREEIAEHRDSGGSFLVLMTHFKRMEILAMAQIARNNRSLQHLQYRTGITARSEMGELLEPFGYIIRHSGAQFVDREQENLGETEEERDARRERNEETQSAGGRFMVYGNWVIWPEGKSKEEVMKDGEVVRGPDGKPLRKPRDPEKLLPVKSGFVYSLKAMPPEKRRDVRILGIAAHYGERRFSILRPTMAIPRLAVPLEGDYDDRSHQRRVRQQGEDLLLKAKADAIAIDRIRG